MPNCLTPATLDETTRPLPGRNAGRELHGAPVIWLLQGPRLGDNEQVLALGAALSARFGWSTRIKQIVYQRAPEARVELAGALDHVNIAASDPIMGAEAGPLPDLVISIGRRAAPVGRWIKSQHAQKAVHVQLGRYQDRFRDIDLLVTTPQYGLPSASNVLQLGLPITTRPTEKLADAADIFGADFADLPRPLIGVLVGGPASPFSFDATAAERLAAEALAFAAARGGTLLVATSPRTPADATEVLARALPAPHRFYPFEKSRQGANPYLGLLALGDAFIVTTDSISMISDAALMGRETRLFPMPMKARRSLWKPSWPVHWAGRRRVDRLNAGKPADLLDRWFDGRVRAGFAQPARYAPILTNRLLRSGQLAWLGDPSIPGTALPSLAAYELDMVLVRIEGLLAERRARWMAARLEAERPMPAPISDAAGLRQLVLADA